jgi:Tfp pilus assembly protein FimT
VTAINDTSGGFTLLELVFVIVIFIVLVTMTAPQFSRALQAQARETGMEDILAMMDFARERAIMDGTEYGVHFDAMERTYWPVRRDASVQDGGFLRIPEKWGQARHLPTDVTFRVAEASVLFRPDGTATPLSLDVISPDSVVRTIEVDTTTGKGTIREHI